MRLISITIIFLFNFYTLALGGNTYPQRIISLGSALTEELYQLGVEDKVVGVTVYCQRPPEANSKEKVGTVVDVDLEKMLSLKPDLVLATSLTNPRQIEKLRNLGVRVASFPQPKNFSEICEQFLELGRIVGEKEEAEEIVHRAREGVNSIYERVKNLSKPRVFVQIGARPLYTVTEDSFIQDFIVLGGGKNIASRTGGGSYSREEVLQQNPDVIIIVTMGIIGEKEKDVWERFETIKAVKEKRIYVVDSYRLCSPTPISFVETLEEIVNILHPAEGR